ncbi:hypothetical protein AVEN_233578-1 [Araneus ventricosus]|uniref:Sm domain-containing protein n=1 Tax=Araneus ventricosus TaxID=182803 RepID=A0A4Y2HQG2_ARAVE|nr:hypothetical protein AVEN_233578-1 [Araneus ventricosus]
MSSSYSRHSSRDSSRREKDSSRRSSPGPSRGRSPAPISKPRDENELPSEFGRPTEPTSKEDENTVLKRMKTAFTHSPLNAFHQCIKEDKKIKIWTRNFEEIRGICAGNVVAFDKHWNLMLSDVDEVYLKPKKAKSPYLDPNTADDLPELPSKVPRVKKPKTPEEEVAQKAANEASAKKPKKKKKGRKSYQRHLKQLFIRGSNIIMVAVLE